MEKDDMNLAELLKETVEENQTRKSDKKNPCNPYRKRGSGERKRKSKSPASIK